MIAHGDYSLNGNKVVSRKFLWIFYSVKIATVVLSIVYETRIMFVVQQYVEHKPVIFEGM